MAKNVKVNLREQKEEKEGNRKRKRDK